MNVRWAIMSDLISLFLQKIHQRKKTEGIRALKNRLTANVSLFTDNNCHIWRRKTSKEVKGLSSAQKRPKPWTQPRPWSAKELGVLKLKIKDPKKTLDRSVQKTYANKTLFLLRAIQCPKSPIDNPNRFRDSEEVSGNVSVIEPWEKDQNLEYFQTDNH